MADKSKKQMDTERILAAKLRENCMAIYNGLKALENIPRFQSQFASLGGNSFEGVTDECYEETPTGAITLTCDDVFKAKAAVDTVANALGQAVAGLNPADIALIEQINIRG